MSKVAKSTAAKSAAAKTATVAIQENAVQVAFVNLAKQYSDRVQSLTALDASTMNSMDAKDHKASLLGAINRAKRANEFASLMDNAKIADVFVAYKLTATAVDNLQIYAQDKLADLVRALALDVNLSACSGKGGHSNRTTQAVVQAMLKNGPRMHSQIIGDMHTITGKALSTCSAQSSSSRQVLELLGMIALDSVSRAYDLTDAGRDKVHVIGA